MAIRQYDTSLISLSFALVLHWVWGIKIYSESISSSTFLITVVSTETDPARDVLLFPRHRAQFISHCSIIIPRLNETCVGIPTSSVRPSVQVSFEVVFCLPATRAGIRTTHDTCHRLRPQAGRSDERVEFGVPVKGILGRAWDGVPNEVGVEQKSFVPSTMVMDFCND